jgi:hypothetical protein
MGRNLGTDLEPNSDRISVRSNWRTLPNIDLSASAYFTRHANASEGADYGSYPSNPVGTIFDDGDMEEGNNYEHLHFLTQDTIDTRIAGGLGIKWSLPVSFGTFSINADYVLEYGWNRDCIKDNDGVTNYWSLGGSWRW